MDSYQIRLINARSLADSAGGPAAFARRLGKSTGQIAHIIGPNPVKNIGHLIARQIEDAFAMPRGWLDTPPANHALGAAMESVGLVDRAGDEFVDVPILGTVDRGAVAEVEVPFYTGVAASAGHGASNSDSPHVKLRFRAESLRRKGIDPGGARLIYVRGDSMEPLMYDGDQIMFDATKRAIRDGELYVVRIDEDELVKRLHKRPGNRLVVQSENPAFAPFELDATSPGFAVLGQVVWRAGWM
jgi:hypothetical protein